jgi:hypothetical protein
LQRLGVIDIFLILIYAPYKKKYFKGTPSKARATQARYGQKILLIEMGKTEKFAMHQIHLVLDENKSIMTHTDKEICRR